MKVKFVTDEKIAETSSKGNQEKWFDKTSDMWYKVDQFGYEALSETITSQILELSNIEKDTPFTFVRYFPQKFIIHKRERTVCVSKNFLKEGESIITIARLLKKELGRSLKDKLYSLSSDKKRIAYLADKTAEVTGLRDFGKYLTILFELDSFILNDDRHLNNIAVIEKKGNFSYCPIFDNGAGLLSNIQMSPMDIMPKALMSVLKARPFVTGFTRQMNTARGLYGKQLRLPELNRKQIREMLEPLLEFYPQRDRLIIVDRVCDCILTRQRALKARE